MHLLWNGERRVLFFHHTSRLQDQVLNVTLIYSEGNLNFNSKNFHPDTILLFVNVCAFYAQMSLKFRYSGFRGIHNFFDNPRYFPVYAKCSDFPKKIFIGRTLKKQKKSINISTIFKIYITFITN